MCWKCNKNNVHFLMSQYYHILGELHTYCMETDSWTAKLKLATLYLLLRDWWFKTTKINFWYQLFSVWKPDLKLLAAYEKLLIDVHYELTINMTKYGHLLLILFKTWYRFVCIYVHIYITQTHHPTCIFLYICAHMYSHTHAHPMFLLAFSFSFCSI